MSERQKPVVLDAGVLIGHLDSEDALHESSERMLERLLHARFVASALTVVECLVHPALRGEVARAERVLERLRLERIPVRADDAAALAAVRAGTGLRMPDAVVVHAAELCGAAVATTDRALARGARARGLVTHEP